MTRFTKIPLDPQRSAARFGASKTMTSPRSIRPVLP